MTTNRLVPTLLGGLRRAARRPIMQAAPIMTTTGQQPRLITRTHLATPLASYNRQLEVALMRGDNSGFLVTLKEMKDSRIRMDSTTWDLVISMLARSDRWRDMFTTLQKMRDAGLPPTVGTYNSLLKYNVTRASSRVIETVLANMEHDQVSVGPTAYDYIITNRSRREPEHALRTLREMNSRGLVPLPSTYLTLIRAFCNSQDLTQAMALLTEAVQRVAVPTNLYQEVIVDFADMYHEEGVMFCWTNIINAGASINDGTCLKVLRFAAKKGRSDLAGDLLRHLTRQGYPCETVHFAALFEALLMADDAAAFGVLDMMKEAKIVVTRDFVLPWTKRLSESTEMFDRGMRLLERMHKGTDGNDTREIHTALFNGALAASVRLQDAERAAETFQAAGRLGVVPNTDSYLSMMDACFLAGQPATAEALLAEMKINNVRVSRAVYARLLETICGQPDGTPFEDAFRYLEEAKAAGIVPSEKMYIVIVRRCARERDVRAKIAMEEMAMFGYTPDEALIQYVETGGMVNDWDKMYRTPSGGANRQ